MIILKRLNFFDKILFLLNTLVSTLLLLSYFLPFLPPKTFSHLAVLSLTVPFLILINILFCVYWLVKIRRQFLLSALVLGLGYNHLLSLYNFSGSETSAKEEGLTLMSYNVRLLNFYNWINDQAIPEKIQAFIDQQSPDILTVQEYNSSEALPLDYPYVFSSASKTKSELVIFSKYPFLDKGIIKFSNSANSAIYADILINSDTLRIYNIHLQSSGVNPNVKRLDSKTSDRLFKRLSKTFEAQQDQAELVSNHLLNFPYKTILSGDFNNTAHSYVYRLLKSNLNDAFEVAGSGFGSTFAFQYFPLRIDFILVDEGLKVSSFKNHNVKYSDHFPISTLVQSD